MAHEESGLNHAIACEVWPIPLERCHLYTPLVQHGGIAGYRTGRAPAKSQLRCDADLPAKQGYVCANAFHAPE
jgi:hypothetical protein